MASVPMYCEDADPVALEQFKAMAAANGIRLDIRTSDGNQSTSSYHPEPSRTPLDQRRAKYSALAVDEFARSCERREKLVEQKYGNQRIRASRHTIQSAFAKPTLRNTGPGPKPMETILVDRPYSPCFRSLHELHPIDLAELTMESHHPGRVLLAKITQVLETTKTTTTAQIEDPKGEVECLKVTFVGMNNPDVGHSWPILGRWLAVKKPYLTINEHCPPLACIGIDHPSDLMDFDGIRRSNLDKHSLLKIMAGQDQRSPLQCKEDGNAALKVSPVFESRIGYRSFLVAEAHYTQGLQSFSDHADSDRYGLDLEQDLYRNRAYARFMLGCYEGAVQDAVASISNNADDSRRKLDAKAYSRAGNAAYKLRRFQDAAFYYQKQNELASDDICIEMLSKIRRRLDESEGGAYDLVHLRKSLSLENPRVDAADYLVNTEVRMSALGSTSCRGLFANRGFEQGDFVLAEKAYSAVWAHEKESLTAFKVNFRSVDKAKDGTIGDVGLWRQTVRQARDNPLLAMAMLDLHGDYKGESSKIPTVDGRSVVDTFQVNDIVARNSFGIDASMKNGQTGGSGLFIRASYINHSCLANSGIKFVGDLIMVYATKPISKGEEITTSYSGFILDSEQRSERIKGVWKFDCTCPLCSAERKESPEAREYRQKLVAKANIRTGNTTLSRYESKITVALVELLASEIEATYNVPLYENLPLPGLLHLRTWFFMGTNCIDCDPAKAKQATIDYLRACAFKVETLNDGKTRAYATANSINPEPSEAQSIPRTLIRTAITVRKLGQAQAAEDLIDFARSVAHALCGPKDDTVAKCLEADARGEFHPWHDDAERARRRDFELERDRFAQSMMKQTR